MTHGREKSDPATVARKPTNKAVATVSGMSGAAAGIGTIISTLLIGRVTDRYSFEPVLIGASLVPVVATVLVFVLIRPRADNHSQTRHDAR